ncbi:glutamine-hydrolyzing GMP synthase [Ruficoccus amylovorans]|uniref:GMP synthase [glutamine-hydrolyzing] n=1 Tax=Ruficoccus amylovorans TaxID=1804625 RepID=A0A842HC78_9BACT|nr:glutamine-hydrolyzing GMP synthase [Ruficoccus amylovorans]MBC2593296.1 glutamine-hydrolyzing GMP synthase [Ruficoccus amylovorans]
MSQIIAVLDFGSQYTQVIARRIRECNVYSKIYPFGVSTAELKKDGVQGIILSGGPSSVLLPKSPRPDPKIFELGVPVLGICYGLQLIGHLLGGKVEKSRQREFGKGTLKIRKKGKLLAGLPASLQVWNSHGDRVIELPKGFEAIASTENSDVAVVQDAKRQIYGMQFHPEVVHSERGIEIIRNFLTRICGCKGDWQMSDYVETAVQAIREQVGDKRVILGLSGGVDSSVAAALIHKAIGKQLTCVFVDNGLLRKGEREKVERIFREHFKINLKVAKSGSRFLKKLKGVTDPERKRKIIGREFVKVFDEEVTKIGQVDFLAQGTLYPDVIESVAIGGNPAALIKSHHNVGGLPKRMKLKLLEPLRELFKDEVRALGEELGLSKEMVWRHPFPGPGLGVRVIGEIKSSYLKILREADAILLEEMKRTGYYEKVWQAFCVFLPVQTVGVMGDERTYDYVIAVRVVESQDAMTADWAHIPHDILQTISSRIINEVKGVNRVVLDISSKPPSTIEWE